MKKTILISFSILLAGWALASCSKFARDRAETPLSSYEIRYASSHVHIDGRIDEAAWRTAPTVGEFQFPWWTEGKKEGTAAKMLWDERYLYVSFVCDDEYIWAEHEERDSPVYRDDCVEVFASPDPDRLNQYFNVEMNVNGASLDFYHPTVGEKEPWDPELIIATSIEGTLNDDSDRDSHWVLEVAIPFAAYEAVAKNTPPQAGDVWRLNLNRLGGRTNPQHSQWAPSRTDKPAFHAPQFFGEAVFVEDSDN